VSEAPILPICPFLPVPPAVMDWRDLHALRDVRGAAFYRRCLEYGHHLWQHGLAARALLALDRALLTDLRGDESALDEHPLPYRAIAWVVARTPHAVFIGNPRVHYQHLADRVRGAREEQRRWRAWACWYLVRLVSLGLPADPRHDVREPTRDEILGALTDHGLPREPEWWQRACRDGDRAQNSRTCP
jgi:hypothetical protein